MPDRIDRRAFDYMTEATADKTAVNLLDKPDRITSDDVHNTLMAAGFTPGLGNVADAIDAVMYAAEGEFGSAGLSAAAMVPFIGQWVSGKRALKAAKKSGEEIVTLYRGTDKWHKGTMVKDGRFVGGKNSLWVTENKDYAKNISQVEGGILLEFNVPKSFFEKEFTYALGSKKVKTGEFKQGLPKEFLKKVHK